MLKRIEANKEEIYLAIRQGYLGMERILNIFQSSSYQCLTLYQ
jgi:hypothetical protein